MTKKHPYLTKTQLENIKEKLLSEREKLSINDYNEDVFCLDKNELADQVDEACINVETAKMLRFRNREVFYLKKINSTLDRIDKGTYGLCDECDGDIGYERLLARPTADLCIACKEEAEMAEKGNVYQSRSKSLGKTMSEIGQTR